ncbi:Macrocin-O-methyltransferase [Candidatus Methylopumilus universalis]
MVAMTFHEAINLYRLTEKTNHLKADIAELGSYSGGSALILAWANKSKRTIHLFDTFEGIPEITEGIDKINIGDVKGSSFNKVKEFLSEFINLISFHKGFFPETTKTLQINQKFSLVNLDADTYKSTLSGLNYFYPRLLSRGILICHDYQSKSCPGVKKAIDEFFYDKPETLIELWHSQVVIVKI